jgi:hypothetical protein
MTGEDEKCNLDIARSNNILHKFLEQAENLALRAAHTDQKTHTAKPPSPRVFLIRVKPERAKLTGSKKRARKKASGFSA